MPTAGFAEATSPAGDQPPAQAFMRPNDGALVFGHSPGSGMRAGGKFRSRRGPCCFLAWLLCWDPPGAGVVAGGARTRPLRTDLRWKRIRRHVVMRWRTVRRGAATVVVGRAGAGAR